MESRKMLLIKLFSGQQWRHRHREQTYGHGGWGKKERAGCMEKVGKHILPYVIRQPMGICCRTQTRAQEQPRGVGWGGGGREVQEEGDIFIPMAGSCLCLAESNTIL